MEVGDPWSQPQQQLPEPIVHDLNNQPMEIDLNGLALEQDDNPQEVILNPAQPQGDFLELNDLLEGNNVVEEVIIEQNVQNNLPPMPQEEQQLFHFADEFQLQGPLMPVNPINLVDEEIPLDQLIGEDELDLPENIIEG